ncbi:MAG: hypothetical protein IPH09_15195 [bacterium]|nr:hypothetical protein [bacterium]
MPLRRFPVLLSIFVLLSLLTHAGCGGGDSPGTPDPEPQPVPVTGSVTLPAGFPAEAGPLTIVCGAGGAGVGGDGAFTVLTGDGSAQLAVVRGADGPLLLGWIAEDAAAVGARSTAEALLFFALGTWLLPDEGQIAVRGLIGDLGVELDALEAAVAAAAVAHPTGLAEAQPAVQQALADAAAAVTAEAGEKGVIVEPAGERSGIAVLNQGGINTLTLKNSYRRRAVVFVQRSAWIGQDDVHHELAEPATSFELPPVGGFAGVLGTIGGWLAGDVAYTPVVSDPLPLELWPDSKVTEYTVKAGGASPPGDTEAWLTPAENAAIELVAIRTVVLDFFVPLMVNIAATSNQLGELDDILGAEQGTGAEVVAFINYCKDNVPAMWAHVQERDYGAAALDLFGAAATTPVFQQTLCDFLEHLLVRGGLNPANAAAALGNAASYLNLVGWINIAGNYMDSIIVASQIALSHHADLWDVRATQPTVHLSSSPTAMYQYDEADSLWVHVADELEDPQGWAFAYHWRCDGVAGTLVDPAHPEDRDNDFTTSRRSVGYVADGGAPGTERIIVEVAITEGGELTAVGADTLTLTVGARTLALTPVTTNVAADAVRWFEAKLTPPLPEGAEAVYAWSGGGSAGDLRSADGTPVPCETADASATYHAGMAAGSDAVHVTVYRVLEGGARRSLGTANATATVRPDMIEGRLVGYLWLYPEEHRFAAPLYVEFNLQPGVEHYQVHGYNFVDFTGYYGTEYLRNGPPFDSHDTQTETVYRLLLAGLGGSMDPDNPPNEETSGLNWNRSRFAGSVWEVWPLD